MLKASKRLPHNSQVQSTFPMLVLSTACLLSACGGNSGSESGQLTPSTDDELVIGAGFDSNFLTGVFIDAPVENLSYVAGNIEGKTDQFGRFEYRDGDTIRFSIGATIFPEILARNILTPLDLYSTDSIQHESVVNVVRLLQTLDTDNNAENGIQLDENIDKRLQGVQIDINSNRHFESSAIFAFSNNDIGIDEIVPGDIALTHFSNSLINNQLADPDSISPGARLTVGESGKKYLTDIDNDQIADIFDQDDDNDGLLDLEDQFPTDSNEWFDFDGDGIGDNEDTDDDNDSVPDADDPFPLDSNESLDTDSDGMGDGLDMDDDNDGVYDYRDAFPKDAAEWSDNDLDGIGDNTDTDDDNDTVLDKNDAFPLDETENSDRDSDGIGDNFDLDNDNDGVIDSLDLFPADISEWLDNDLDGIGDNSDDDDDNDGVIDAHDALPLDASEYADLDSDGIGDNADTDNDNDGIPDELDQFPHDTSEHVDFDADGIGDNADNDDDGDGSSDYLDGWNPVYTVNMNAPFNDRCGDYLYIPSAGIYSNHSRSLYTKSSVFCYLYYPLVKDQDPLELKMYSSSMTVHGNLVQRKVTVAMEFEPFNWLDSRNLKISLDVLVSIEKGRPESLTVEVPEGTNVYTVYTDENHTTTGNSFSSGGGVFKVSSDGTYTLNFSAVEKFLFDNGYDNVLDIPDSWAFTIAFSGIDYDVFKGGAKLQAGEYTIEVGDRKIIGAGQKIRFVN